MKKVTILKEFLEKYRYKELEEVFLTTNDDLKQLKIIVQRFDELEYQPEKLHYYYDEIKECITMFIKFWEEGIDQVVKDVDKCRNDQEAVAELVQANINRAHALQIDFGHGYLPVTSAREREVYDYVENKFRDYVDVLYHIKERADLRCLESDQEKFRGDLIQQTLEKTCEMYEFTQNYIGVKLLENIDRIASSLDHTIIHVRNELHRLHGERRDKVSRLLGDLREARQGRRRLARTPCSHGYAEFQKTIDVISQKLDTPPNYNRALRILEEALVHWTSKRREVGRFNNILLKLQDEATNCEQQEEIYHTKVCKELPGSKQRIWEEIGNNIQEQKLYVQRKKMEVARALVTHFNIKGPNDEFYNDYVGKFHKDQFGYRLYTFDRGLRKYFANCDGNLVKMPPPDDIVYRDAYSRYIPDDKDPMSYSQHLTLDDTSRKLYRRNEYSSCYKLATNQTFVKVSEDCGHSDNAAMCGMQAQDPEDYVLLPSSPPLPILKKVLQTESVQYIWSTFGGVVTEALVEVFLAKPKNPIHHLAHCLVKQINKTLRSEYELLKKEARKYREDILTKRRDDLAAQYLNFKAKQVRRRKPEESDDSYNWMVYYQQQAAEEFVTQINDINWT